MNGRPLAKENLGDNRPERVFVETCPIPTELTRGRTKVTATFTAHSDKMAGGVFDLRIIRPNPESTGKNRP